MSATSGGGPRTDGREATARPKVVFEHVDKSFDQRGQPLEVLKDISLTVHEGEFVLFLGPSGCGKSTLLNIVGGFEHPDSGRVTIDGETVTQPDPRRIFVFQEYGIFPWASVWSCPGGVVPGGARGH